MLLTKMNFTKASYLIFKDRLTFYSSNRSKNLCDKIYSNYGIKLLCHSKISTVCATTSKKLHHEMTSNDTSSHNICTAQNILCRKAYKQTLNQSIRPLLAGILVDNRNHVRQYSSATNIDPEIPDLVAPQYSGFFKLLSESAPVQYAQDCIVSLHSYTGLPWWATIILMTCTLRAVVMFPLAIYQQRNIAKLANLKYEMEDIVRDLKMEANYAVGQYNYSEAVARRVYKHNLNKEWNKLIVRENCHPMKNYVLMLLQVPVWVILSAALRNLCYMMPKYDATAYSIFEELTTGGFGWIVNLVQTDTLFILPIILGVSTLLNIEIHNAMRVGKLSTVQRYALYFFRGFSIAMIPLSACVPSCVCLYWVSSTGFGVFQNLVMLSPKFRRSVGIPETDIEHENPYSYLYEQMKRPFLKDSETPIKS